MGLNKKHQILQDSKIVLKEKKIHNDADNLQHKFDSTAYRCDVKSKSPDKMLPSTTSKSRFILMKKTFWTLVSQD